MKYSDLFKSETLIFLLLAVAVIFLIFLIAFGLFNFITDIRRELRFINGEISRSQGNERKHWKRKKRKLILSLILPFYGKK